MRKLIYGVGDPAGSRPLTVEGGRCEFYARWHGMLMRCYSAKYQAKYPTYRGFTVCREWLEFANFKAWMAGQDFVGMHLDKDLIDPESMEYAPSNCAFIPGWLNKAFNENAAQRSQWGVGIKKKRLASGDTYSACISIDGRTTHLGTYQAQEEASAAYQQAKISYQRDLVDRYAAMGSADQRVVAALRARHF